MQKPRSSAIPTATSPYAWRLAKSHACGKTISSRNCLYQSTGLPLANSATRFGWNPRKRGDTARYGTAPHANSTVSFVHTAFRNHAPTTIRSTASQICGAFMPHLRQSRHNQDGGMLELDHTNVNSFFIDD